MFGTIAVAAVGGLLTGVVLKLPYLASPCDEKCFDDELFFNVPPDYNCVNGPVFSERQIKLMLTEE